MKTFDPIEMPEVDLDFRNLMFNKETGWAPLGKGQALKKPVFAVFDVNVCRQKNK